VGKKIRSIAKQTLAVLQAYAWPGNIRELQNVIERAVVLCEGETFSVEETWLQPDLPRASTQLNIPLRGLGRVDAQQEREMIEAALADSQGRIAGQRCGGHTGLPRQTWSQDCQLRHQQAYRFQSGDHPASSSRIVNGPAAAHLASSVRSSFPGNAHRE
jgi:formate hydrogenlyase transcriptional activator